MIGEILAHVGAIPHVHPGDVALLAAVLVAAAVIALAAVVVRWA